ncbi:asparaginase domain-containing protein, partial [Candidatus Saccharibacteria bacterium]|nr:asparaginase domain-containing protein [Candidatus Saccharibacteria bacterium]
MSDDVKHNATILFLKMGGTIEFIDPGYDEMNRKIMKVQSSIDCYLNDVIKPHFNYRAKSIAEKDSRDITDRDREILLNEIKKSEEKRIIVTHGTFTLVKTAKYIRDRLGDIKDKAIVLTASMVPLAGFTVSDAGFNLGFSVASVQRLRGGGVYICMNGALFNVDEVHK